MLETVAWQRVRLDLAYDGSAFHGWARQPGERTVQAVLEDALATILRCSPRELKMRVAGRTDTGVHASGQVAHFDVPAELWRAIADSIVRRLAGVLPPDVRVAAAYVVPQQFDARFAALWRRYEYRISDAGGGVDPLRRRFTLWWPRALDDVAMGRAGAGLVGLHDFAAFCRRREGATTIRSLTSLRVARADSELVCTVEADAFCHSMVRSLVGALLAVGEGRYPSSWPASLLARDRRADEVPVAPPHGLNLLAVGYPPDSRLAARTLQTMAIRTR